MNIMGNLVTLRAIELSDCDLLRALMNDPDTEYLLGGYSFPISSQQQQKWVEALPQNTSTLRVMIEVDGKAVGTAILTDIDYKNGSAEIHIKLESGDARGKGYGADTIKSLVKYAFDELRLHCIYARVNAYNTVSQRAFEKCGFEREGIMRQRIYKQGKYADVYLFSILNRGSKA